MSQAAKQRRIITGEFIFNTLSLSVFAALHQRTSLSLDRSAAQYRQETDQVSSWRRSRFASSHPQRRKQS
jgi:hypothetical protein